MLINPSHCIEVKVFSITFTGALWDNFHSGITNLHQIVERTRFRWIFPFEVNSQTELASLKLNGPKHLQHIKLSPYSKELRVA